MRFLLTSLVCSSLIVSAIHVNAQTPFYQGKTITLVIGSAPGGTADLRTKPIALFLRKHIPGNPTIVMDYMPGGGSRKAANHIYNVARRDGLTIGRMSSSIVPNAVLGELGVQYDLDKLVYLGAAESAVHNIFLSRKKAGLDSLDTLRSSSRLRIGTNPVGHTIYIMSRVFAYLIGLKDPQFIPAYDGPELDLALLRGEVDAQAAVSSTVNREWIEKTLVNFHAVLEIPKGRSYPGFTHLPELESFVKSDTEVKLLGMVRAFRQVGAPIILPPGTPPERIEILREAVRRMFNDPDFHKEYKKLTGDDATPLLPEEQERVIRELPRERAIVELYKVFVGGGPLPSRS